jgi:hypothetical protein
VALGSAVITGSLVRGSCICRALQPGSTYKLPPVLLGEAGAAGCGNCCMSRWGTLVVGVDTKGGSAERSSACLDYKREKTMDFCGKVGLADTGGFEILGGLEKLVFENLKMSEMRLELLEKIPPLRQFELPPPGIQDFWL